jgi:NADH:ubiquinone oxidoreductase subunit B-like Fe-S oxidoreductase
VTEFSCDFLRRLQDYAGFPAALKRKPNPAAYEHNLTLLGKLAKWARKRSPWVFHINASSCNGCDIEIVASLTPRYDIERFGAVLLPSPRHADVLLVAGTVNAQTKDRLRRV